MNGIDDRWLDFQSNTELDDTAHDIHDDWEIENPVLQTRPNPDTPRINM